MQIFGEALLKYDIERPAENVNISNWWYLAKAYLPCCCWRLACWLAGSDRSWWISKENFSSLSIHGLSLESQRRRCLKHCKYWECSPATLRSLCMLGLLFSIVINFHKRSQVSKCLCHCHYNCRCMHLWVARFTLLTSRLVWLVRSGFDQMSQRSQVSGIAPLDVEVDLEVAG